MTTKPIVCLLFIVVLFNGCFSWEYNLSPSAKKYYQAAQVTYNDVMSTVSRLYDVGELSPMEFLEIMEVARIANDAIDAMEIALAQKDQSIFAQAHEQFKFMIRKIEERLKENES